MTTPWKLELITPDNCVLCVIDYQPQMIFGVQSQDRTSLDQQRDRPLPRREGVLCPHHPLCRGEQELQRRSPFFPEELDLWVFGALSEGARADAEEPTDALAFVTRDERELVFWAERCAPTFAAKAALVSGERARLEGRQADAERGFERAAELARRHGLVHEEALAHELAARLYAARGVGSVARAKLAAARACYARWGALGKASRLEAELDAVEERSGGGALADALEQLDVKVLVSALQSVSSSLELTELVAALLKGALQHAAAERGVLVLLAGEPRIRALATSEAGSIRVVPADGPASPELLPESVLCYVLRSSERVVTQGGVVPAHFQADAYLARKRVRSMLCLPIVVRGKALGALYLENTLTTQAFSARGVALLDLMASQAAIALENARLYAGLHETQQRMAQAEHVSRTGSFSLRPQSQQAEWSDEVSRIYGIEGRRASPSCAHARTPKIERCSTR